MNKTDLCKWILQEIETTPDELQDALIGVIAIKCRLELESKDVTAELFKACQFALTWMKDSEHETGKPMGEGLGYKGKLLKPVVVEKLHAAILTADRNR